MYVIMLFPSPASFYGADPIPFVFLMFSNGIRFYKAEAVAGALYNVLLNKPAILFYRSRLTYHWR